MLPRRFSNVFETQCESNNSLDDALVVLRSRGANIAECIQLVKDHTGCSLVDAKRLVTTSKAWQDVTEATRRAFDEAFEESESAQPNREDRDGQ